MKRFVLAGSVAFVTLLVVSINGANAEGQGNASDANISATVATPWTKQRCGCLSNNTAAKGPG